MPIHRYTIMQDYLPFARNVLMQRVERNWGHSPKVNGQLRLRSNPYSKSSWVTDSFSTNGSDSLVLPPIGGSPKGVSARQRAYNQAYARFRGMLYKDSASLGVTFAQFRQTRDMVVSRFKQLASSLDELYERALRLKAAGTQKSAKAVASTYLEYQFGWKPLVQDIHNSVKQAIEGFPESGAIKASGYADWSDELIYKAVAPYQYDDQRFWEGNVTTTVGCRYWVSNPNLWALERLGLLNVGAIAWDKVPWSFVVNMFVSTGSIVNSITDFTGLQFDNLSTTQRMEESVSVYRARGDGKSTSTVSGTKFDMNRVTGDLPRPNLALKCPDVNWELAATAASLVTQRLPKLSRVRKWAHDLGF